MERTGIRRFVRRLAVILLPLLPAVTVAGGLEAWPAFSARYSVTLAGVKSAETVVSLARDGDGRCRYRQVARPVGMAALLSSDRAVQVSRLLCDERGIRPLEFLSRRPKGDADDNAHLLFDWDAGVVENRGAGDHWRITLRPGTQDSLSMQLALMAALREGRSRIEVPVAVRGRIKHYRFERVGEERVDTPAGDFMAIKLARTDDDRDRSWFWLAPELDYLLVRFVKKKKNGLGTEMLLQSVRF